ncbi:hypothetical protein M9Y10_015615 [Tritrichomonas musculus]|uniref:Protein kinase domain-containing protein n=1 Tax=Tritrichomonas musculus TaxID=1915356 RepID=A0ABR2L2R9_9EUKA
MSNENEVIDLSQFTVKDKIGGGYFSQVSIIEDKDTKQIYAAKFFTKIPENKTQSDMLYVSREVNFGAGMNHPSIIKFIGYSPKNFENEDKPIIITEYCKNGSLYNFIQEQNKYPELLTDTKKLIIIYGIAAGMKYLHSNNILHRDLKPENILLDDRLLPKIADFGLIKMESMNDLSNYIQSTDGMKGTALYQPREAISYGSQNPKTDVYSFALIVYYIMTSIVPFSDVRDKFTVKLIDGYRPEFKSPINESYKKFIEECWAQEPNDRPSFDDIVKLLKKPEFITEKVNKEDYLSYVKYIEDYQSSFDAKKKIVDLEDYIPEASASFARIDIARYVEEPKKTILSSIRKRLGIEQEKLFPFSEFNKLCDSCKKLVTEAENDPDKQFIIAKNLHDGTSKFPKNIEISVRYLERSTEKGNIEDRAYWIHMSVKEIKDRAFDGCIKLPSSLVEIAEYAFEGCSSLKHVLFASPYYLVSIGKNAFCGCSSLKEISIPSSVDDIGDYAFVKCSSLTKIEILSSTAEIGSGVFDECSSLREISIPSEFQKPINFVSSNVKINII